MKKCRHAVPGDRCPTCVRATAHAPDVTYEDPRNEESNR